MNFRTEIKPLNCQGSIDHNSRIMLIGSCFTDEIGTRLADANFDVSVNPMGTLYNPASIADELNNAIYPGYNAAGLLETPDGWRSFHRHSRFSALTREDMADRLLESWVQAGEYLKRATHLIITFGSTFAFYHKKEHFVVANCHKVPAEEFERIDLGVIDICKLFDKLLQTLFYFNHKLNVILTVSPVRHSGYGLVADRFSKSKLIVACHALAESHTNVSYFPAYEALVDDLRDYRFYADDLAHPSKMGADYIYNVFAESYFSPPTQELAQEWEKLSRLLKHRASTPEEAERLRNRAFHKAISLANAVSLAKSDIEGKEILERFRQRYSNGTEN